MTRFKGFTLIEVLVVLAVLIIILAGWVVVWERKATPTLTPTPTPELRLSPTQYPVTSTPSLPIIGSLYSPSQVIANKDLLVGKKIKVKGYLQVATDPELMFLNPYCKGFNLVLSDGSGGDHGGEFWKIRSGYAAYPDQVPKAIALWLKDQFLSCKGEGRRPDCEFICPSDWEIGRVCQVVGIWRHEGGNYYLEILSKGVYE